MQKVGKKFMWSKQLIFKSASLSQVEAEQIESNRSEAKSLFGTLEVRKKIVMVVNSLCVFRIENPEQPEKSFSKGYLKDIGNNVYETGSIKCLNKLMAILKSAEKAGKENVALEFSLEPVPSKPEFKFIKVTEIEY